MTGFLKKMILLGFCAGAVFIAVAQVKFTASISPAQISQNEYAVLRLEVQNADNVEQITPPSLKDFTVVSGPNQESGMSNVNGVVKQYLALSYILKPNHMGTINLGASTAKIAGKILKSGRLKLSVKKPSGGSNPAGNMASVTPFPTPDSYAAAGPTENFDDYILKEGENVQAKVDRNMQLKLHANKTSCYVGEPIIATYKLYTRLKSESKLSKTPSFNGFSVIDLQRPDETEYAREKLNGVEFNVYTIRKAQLYPLQDGLVELESATLDNRIQFLKGDAAAGPQQHMNGFIDGFAVSPDAVVTETVSLSNKPVTITVKPLPTTGKPAGFKGAVGKFNMTATLEKNSFANNETGKLIVTVSGSGNLQLLTAPEITWPAGIEPFEPEEKEELEQMTVPVSGKKIFTFSFAVDSPGNYQVPAIDFSYFDPALAAYKEIKIPPRQFIVTKGLPRPAYPVQAIVSKQSAGFSKVIFDNRGWVVAGIALVMFSGIIVWLKKERKTRLVLQTVASSEPSETVVPREEQVNLYQENINFNLQNPLGKSGDCLKNSDCTQFYSLLYGEMKDWLGSKFLLRKEELNLKTISQAMDRAGIENDVVLQLQELLQEIEWQLYTPYERGEEMAVIYSRSQALLQSINSYETATL